MDMSRIVLFVGVGVCGLAILFSILAVSLPWLTGTISSVEIKITLWKYCFEYSNGFTTQKQCNDIEEGNIKYVGLSVTDVNAVRAMTLLGMLCLISAVACVLVKLFVMKEQKMPSFAAGGLSILAGLFLMASFSLFAAELTIATFDKGGGFATAIIGWLASWSAGGLIIVSEVINKEPGAMPNA